MIGYWAFECGSEVGLMRNRDREKGLRRVCNRDFMELMIATPAMYLHKVQLRLLPSVHHVIL